ncbi:aldehyde dehydrogenase family protein [Oscillatoria amoena NRMC-F 0135]|nr:aldehyde dehydrogenase family protein [Oscillatoria amoena NRMC-F 0135]
MSDIKIEPRQYALWIDGAWQTRSGGETIHRNSPAHDCLVAEYVAGGAADVDAAVAAARRAFEDARWSGLTGGARANALLKLASLIRRDAARLAMIETLESGKPIRQARDEMEWAAGIWDYAASLARQLHGQTYNQLGSSALGMTIREPIGVVGLITPWNFPLLIISQKLPFALAAGCTAVIKPSEFTSGTTLCLAELCAEAGVPAGVVNVVTGLGDPVGQRIAEHPDVDMVSFTGSTRVGKQVVAASQHNLKKVALELGGKNPQIVFDDADLEAASDAIVFGVLFNMGECCNSGSRLLVQDSIADALIDRVVRRARTVVVGDPLDERTQVGAIINRQQFDKICSYVASGVGAGARAILGGGPLTLGRGLYIEPTILDHATPGMEIAREEIFGPVLTVVRFRDADEVIRIANDTDYGLSASVWTRDFDRAVQLSRRIRTGTVWINTFMDGSPELPFGGYRQSGLGRELGSAAVEEYTELKTLYAHLGPRTGWWSGGPATS